MTHAKERVLITGGSGFLGANLVRGLLGADTEVHLLLRPGTPRWRLAGLEGAYTAHDGDLTDVASVRRAVQRSQPDVVYHLAAAGLRRDQADQADVLHTNLRGTANLLGALDGHPYRILVHAGTGAEYGPCDEAVSEDAPERPQTDYARSKAAATELCRAAARRGQPVVTVRIFAAYGPWEAAERLVPYVMGCCVRGERPRLSAGWQFRDFIFAGDVIALLRMAATTPGVVGQILHAATGRDHSVRELVTLILSVCGRPQLEPLYGAEALRPGEPARYLASIERTAALTGWRPRLDLQAGLERTWNWFQGAGRQAA